ncbi:MAG: DNA polymerase-3 subunit delta [Pirellulaceae bacterium]|jgi:DNA polymerase-3 subunit delta
MPTQHAIEFLANPVQIDAPICVLFGDEAFLKRQMLDVIRQQVLGEVDDDVPYALCEGKQTQWVDVSDELSTVSLFGGGGPRLVVVEDADPFVSSNRTQLEDYLAKKSHPGKLILVVNTWASNTRLYKAANKIGLQIECKAPLVGKGKSLDKAKIYRWIIDWGKQQHNIIIGQDAAAMLVDLVGPEFGLLDQDLAKLALYVEPTEKIGAQMISDIVGGWRTKTIWELLDAAADGNTPEALAQLNRLLQNGDAPLALFAQISWGLRRFATATRIFELAEQQKRKIGLTDALIQGGFAAWNKAGLSRAQTQLKQLGRKRAGRLLQWLTETDLALKSSHSSDDRARYILESLIVKLSSMLAANASPNVGK